MVPHVRVNAGIAAILLTLACADKAQPNYAKCVQLNAKGEVEAAWSACEAAVAADPNSTSGTNAAKTLAELKPEYDRKKASREAAEAKAAEERQRAEKEQRARALAVAKRKVESKLWSFERDGECAGKGLPPYRRNYEGGSFEEDELVAFADGCSHLFPGRTDPQLFMTFCCPR